MIATRGKNRVKLVAGLLENLFLHLSSRQHSRGGVGRPDMDDDATKKLESEDEIQERRKDEVGRGSVFGRGKADPLG